MVDFKRPLACDGYFLVFLLSIDTDIGLLSSSNCHVKLVSEEKNHEVGR